MTRLYLVRHAKPAATWSEAADPGLDPTGLPQAQTAAQHLAARLANPLPLYTSPLLRCRQTAEPLQRLWRSRAQILSEVAEIPAPPLVQRHLWLAEVMDSTWSQLQQQSHPGWPSYEAWRNTMLTTVTALPEDSVIFSHFIAINVLVGAAQHDDRVVCFRPDYASITVLTAERGELHVVELGRQAKTLVLARR